MVVVHGLFGPSNRTVLAQWGLFGLGLEGLQYAGLVCARLAAALAASLLVVQTTSPRLLLAALAQAGWPPWAVYLLGSPLLLLPQVERRAQAIRAAQQARGFETEGGRLQRARAVLPLVVPLVFSLLVEVEERALALEIRAFNSEGPKTSLTWVDDARAERLVRWAMLSTGALIAALGIGMRIYGAG
jgi:energy-coupling factor transport system permease protein